MTNAELAAVVITRARRNSGLTTPEFDYMISVDGIGGPMSELSGITYEDPDNPGHVTITTV